MTVETDALGGRLPLVNLHRLSGQQAIVKQAS